MTRSLTIRRPQFMHDRLLRWLRQPQHGGFKPVLAPTGILRKQPQLKGYGTLWRVFDRQLDLDPDRLHINLRQVGKFVPGSSQAGPSRAVPEI
jgi:hypothetical protein